MTTQRKHSPVVLIVEDEPLLRWDTAEALDEAGFAVLEAGSAEEALQILSHRGDVSAVISDVEMPGSLNGFALAREICQSWPEIGVVMVSARTVNDREPLPERVGFLAKPVRMNTLVERVRNLIETRQHAY